MSSVYTIHTDLDCRLYGRANKSCWRAKNKIDDSAKRIECEEENGCCTDGMHCREYELSVCFVDSDGQEKVQRYLRQNQQKECCPHLDTDVECITIK